MNIKFRFLCYSVFLPFLFSCQVVEIEKRERINQLTTGLIEEDTGQYINFTGKDPDLLGLLPEFIDLSKRFPPVKNQGVSNSCVGWSVGYYLAGFLHRENNPEKVPQFSPSHIYNAIKKGDGCGYGARISDALIRMQSAGSLPYVFFPFKNNDTNCPLPQSSMEELASMKKLRKWARLKTISIADIKSMIAEELPVVVGIKLNSDRFRSYDGTVNFENGDDEDTNHAMVIVGYSDQRNAFKLVNSFGKSWGDKGFMWLDYGSTNLIHSAFVASNSEEPVYVKNFSGDTEIVLAAGQSKLTEKIVLDSLRHTIGLKIGETPAGYDYYPVAIWLDLNDQFTNDIRDVRYYFNHPTFSNPKRPDPKSNSYMARWNGYGCVFDARIEIDTKSGGTITVPFKHCDLWANGRII